MLFRYKNVVNIIKCRFNHVWHKPKGYDTGIKVYNCIAKEIVPLILRDKNFATWYTCGPTVYDSAHAGHASCYLKLDIIQRILKDHFKINLVTVMNITDVDDKIILKSNESGVHPNEVARFYENEFWDDLKSLNIAKADRIVRVTEHISVILEFIDKLLINKMAYKALDGSIYFDVNEFKLKHVYGKLHNIGEDNLTKDDAKKTTADFALWKAPKENEIFWDSKHGPGRPGWHIECSALAGALLGSQIDFHAGGIDLRFPHHENEEAQSCAYFDQNQWVNYWLHTGHLHQKDAEKMSKSLKNTISIQELLSKCKPEVFRMACLMSHYRKNMEFTDNFIQTAENYLDTYKNFINLIDSHIKGELIGEINKETLLKTFSETINNVNNALENDFDTSTCLKTINSLITTTNKMFHTSATINEKNVDNIATLIAISNYIIKTLNMFGLDIKKASAIKGDENEFSNVMNILVNFRHDLRQLGINNKDSTILKMCDNVRDNVKKCGININDRGKVTTWSK